MYLFIGPTTGVITGQSIALLNLLKNFKKQYLVLNTNFEGKNLFYKLYLLLNLFLNAHQIKQKPKTIYISLKRSFFGLIGDYILLRKFLFQNSKIVLHIHGMDINYEAGNYFYKKIFTKIWDNSDIIIILSPKLKQKFKLLREKKIIVINNYSEKMISPDDLNKKVNQFYQKPLKILFLSNLIYSKGIIDVIKAINLINKPDINIELYLAGQILGDDFYSQAKLQKEISKNINKNIFLKGVTNGDEKWRLLKNSDVLILPTFYKSEFQPISIIEAMAHGCLVICTDHGAIVDSFGKDNLLIVEKNNPHSIKSAITKIIEYPHLYKKTILNSYKKIQLNFDMTKINNSIYKLLN